MKKNHIISFILVTTLVIFGAMEVQSQNNSYSQLIKSSLSKNTKTIRDTSDIEKIFIATGLVDVQSLDSTIKVDLRYSSTLNFIGIDFYGDLEKAYLQKDVAEKFVKANKLLQNKFPEITLVIYDAARPLSIQKMMWDSIKVPEDQKEKFLANPRYGSLHNYGAAVDVILKDTSGKEIDMGTSFDSFEKLSYPALEKQFIKTNELTEQQLKNRLILRNVMKEAGFNHIQTEWWHFSTCSRDKASELYTMVITHQLPKKANYSELIASQNKEEEIVESEIKNKINITFKIQILSSTKKINKKDPIFKGIDVQVYHHDGLYKYTAGEFRDIALAHEYQTKMQELGFKDSFVAGFNNDLRIGIHDAIELLQFN